MRYYEENRWKRMVIRVWYSIWFRVGVLLFPTYNLLLVPLLWWIFHDVIMVRGLVIAVYLSLLYTAIMYNDFTNLERLEIHPRPPD